MTADSGSAQDAAEDAQNTVNVALAQNPAVLPVSGVKIDDDSFETENGTLVYTAQFEVEDGDAVMDVITEVNEATGDVHRIKVVTEGDG